MRRMPRVARFQCGAFTVAQATAAGWTESALRHAVATDRLLVVRRGVLAVPPEPSEYPWVAAEARHRIETAAALLAAPGSVASHASAALLVGLPVLDASARPCLTMAGRALTRMQGIHVHRAHIGPPVYVGNLPLTPPAFAVVDTARDHGAAAGLVIADAALHDSQVTEADLERALAARRGWPGITVARRVVAEADGRAESPLESLSRWAMREHGLPAPEPQVEIWIDGRLVGRADFYWDEFGVIGEADGWGKYDGKWAKFTRQKRKDASYERAGAVVVRWDSDEVDRFEAVAARIRDGLRRGASRPRSERKWVAKSTA